MLNKKAAIPANAIRGIIFYSFVAIIGILIFYGCNIQKAKEAYAEVKVATEEFNAIEDFNRFFEMPLNQEMRIIEIIEESYLTMIMINLMKLPEIISLQKIMDGNLQ